MPDLENFAMVLRGRLSELTGRLVAVEHALDERPNPDAEERAVEREDDEVLEGLGQAGLAEIAAIRSALDRIEQGSFGICVACGSPISEARLKAIPHTSRCRKCA